MERKTLMAHEAQWVEEPQPVRRDLVQLNGEERDLFDDLRDNRICAALRLEQESIGFDWVKAALESLLLECGACPEGRVG